MEALHGQRKGPSQLVGAEALPDSHMLRHSKHATGCHANVPPQQLAVQVAVAVEALPHIWFQQVVAAGLLHSQRRLDLRGTMRNQGLEQTHSTGSTSAMCLTFVAQSCGGLIAGVKYGGPE